MRWLRGDGARGRRVVAWAAGGVALLLALVWVVAATGLGMSVIVPAALERAAPPGWTVTVGGVDGAWPSRIRLHDVELRGPHASASVQELLVDYRVLPLLSRTIDLRHIRMVRPSVRADLTSSGRDAETARARKAGAGGPGGILSGSPLGAWVLRVSRLEVRSAAATLLRESGTYEVSDVRVRGAGELGPSGARVHLDTLVAEVRPPAPGDSVTRGGVGSGRLVLAADLADGVLDVRTLSFQSPRSRLAASGELLLASVPGLVDSVDFELLADPLDLRDLPVALPKPWAEQPRMTLRVTTDGAVDSMVVVARAEGPGETSVEARAVLRTAADTLFEDDEPHAPALELTADLRGDLSPWSLGPLGGEASAELTLRLDTLSLRAPGTVHATLVHRPSADTVGGLIGRDLRVDLDASRGPAPHGAAGDGRPGEGGPLEAAATIYGAGAGPDGWRQAGHLRASGTERRARWQVDLQLDSGSLAGGGSVAWADERLEVVADRLELVDFDASALASRLPSTDLTARLEGRVAGAAIDELSGTVALQVSPSSFAGSPVEAATLRARLAPGGIEGAIMADAAGREMSSDFELALSDSTVRATLTELRLSTPADTVAGDTTPAGLAALEMRGGGAGTWALGEPRRATFSLALDSALVGVLAMHDGTIEGTLVGDSLSARASLRIADLLSAPASVDASLHARGAAPGDMIGRLDMSAVRTALDSAAAGAERRADTLAVTVTADEPGELVLSGRLLPAEGGRVDIDARARMAPDTIVFDLLAAGGMGEPTDLLRQATFDTLALEASGTREAGAWNVLRASFLVRDAEWRGVLADTMRMAMSADPSMLRLDTLDVQSEVLVLAGGGTLPRSGNGTGRLDFRAAVQLEPLHDVVDAELPEIGENEVNATVTGTTASAEVVMSLEATAVSYGSTQIAGVSAEARALVEPPLREDFGITEGGADLRLDVIALPDTDVQNLTASVTGSPDSLRLEVSARVDGERTGELIASIDPRPDGRTAELERFQLQLDEDRWELVQPARVSYGDGFSLRSFHLAAGEQAILLDGGLTGRGALDLSVAMDSTDIGTVTDLLGFPRLDGWLGGSVSLEGTVEAPRGSGDVRAGFHTEGRAPTTADLRFETEGGQVAAEVDLLDPTGGTLTVDGSFPLSSLRRDTTASASATRAVPWAPRNDAPAPESLDVHVEADAFDVSSAVAFVDSELLATLGGRVDASLQVGGTARAPSLRGPLELSGGSARLPELGVTWEEMRLHAHGEGSRLVLDSARIRAGPGYVDFAGTASLDSSVDLDIGANLEEFQAIRSEQYEAVVSGSLHMGGTPTAPVVEGDLQVESLDVYLGEDATTAALADVELSEEDLQTLRQRFGYVPDSEDDADPVSDRLTADLTVQLSRDSWIRKRASPEMAVAFTGEIQVQIRPQAEPRLQGTVTTIAERGYIAQFGKRFEPREGTVTLDGPPDSARVALSATYTIPSHTNPDNAEVTIVLSAEGTQDSLSLALSSEPPMENADIVSYIATGRPAASNLALGGGGGPDEAGAGEQGGLAEAGAGIAIGQIIGAVQRAAQEGVGLDVVEIQREGLRGTTLVAGKYLSPRLYVGIAQPVTQQEGDGLLLGDERESEVEIEYQALRGLLLNIEGSDSALRIFLRGRLAY